MTQEPLDTGGLPPDRAPSTHEPAGRPPRTRAATAWVSVCVAALLAIALITFLAQNTGKVQVSFLWMNGSTSLAIALLIAMIGGVLITLVIGTTRIVQLRRYARKHGD